MFSILRPYIFSLDPEVAHDLAIKSLKANFLPKSFFDIAPPTLADYQRVARKKRNGASPGFNAISYVPYKKCPAILKVQVEIAKRIWKEQLVPEEWAIAFMILLSKSA